MQTDWMVKANCASAVDDLVTNLDAELADRYCTGCPVTAECLAFGLETAAHGVWGGRLLSYGRTDG